MIPTWIASLIVVFYLGYWFRGIKNHIEKLEQVVKTKIDKPVVEEPQSELLDPDDPIAEAQYQYKKMMKELNEK